jgi:GNAT superfamily N-acetyltransferase
MEIQVFKEASKIPEKFLPSLVDAEIECWWSEPFKEFLKCSDPKCWKLHSIQDIYWSLKVYRERKQDKTHICECSYECEEVYPKEDFLETAREYVKWKVSAVLLINNELLVRGFWIISANTLWNLLDFELATRPNSYNKKELLRELSRVIFNKDEASNEDITILHQIFVWEELRWTWYGRLILEELIKLSKENWLHLITETRFDSNFYPITRSLWSENVTNDKYWYIIQFLEHQKLLTEIWERISKWFSFYKDEATKILQQNPSFSWKLSY